MEILPTTQVDVRAEVHSLKTENLSYNLFLESPSTRAYFIRDYGICL